MDPYLEAVGVEISHSRNARRPPRTIYVGGGTPSSIGTDRVARLLHTLTDVFPIDNVKEFTVECNPDDVTPRLAETLVAAGVNRVSMGAQSLTDSMLRFMGRRHSAAQVSQAISTLRSAGITNISIDMIYGLPIVEGYDFHTDLRRFIDLQVPHLSAYSLQYEEGSRFMSMLDSDLLTPVSEDEVADQNEALCHSLRNAGYLHYELSNFALPGFQAIHNSSYWDRTPYEGFGPGASSFDGTYRYNNTHSVQEYIQSIRQGQSPSTTETLTPSEVAEEVIMLRLRTATGLLAEEIPAPIRYEYLPRLQSELSAGNLILTPEGRMRIPENKWFVSNDIIARLF